MYIYELRIQNYYRSLRSNIFIMNQKFVKKVKTVEHISLRIKKN